MNCVNRPRTIIIIIIIIIITVTVIIIIIITLLVVFPLGGSSPTNSAYQHFFGVMFVLFAQVPIWGSIWTYSFLLPTINNIESRFGMVLLMTGVTWFPVFHTAPSWQRPVLSRPIYKKCHRRIVTEWSYCLSGVEGQEVYGRWEKRVGSPGGGGGGFHVKGVGILVVLLGM